MTIARLPLAAAELRFRALGTGVRLWALAPDAAAVLARVRADIEAYDAHLSRFRPGSALSRLNADPRRRVPAGALLREAVAVALDAASASGGLVDPCLLDALEAAGYRDSFRPGGPVPPPAGHGTPAAPSPAARWRAIRVTPAHVERPAGLRLDLGGTGKGHAVDRAAVTLARRARRWIADAGGDVRVGGAHTVHVAHPLDGAAAAVLDVADCAVATSSVVARAWRTPGGGRAHHLLDPATGRPAWSGLLQATAVAPTALEAETLAKIALLRGPAAASEVLARHGGVAVDAGGAVQVVPARAGEAAA